jgi:hypothetical protein
MYKHLLLILTLTYSLRSYSQDDSWMVDEVTEEICSLLISRHNDKTATKEEINEIFYGTILKGQNTWNPPMEKSFPDTDQEVRNSAYYIIINQKLLLNCPAFEQYDGVIDKTFTANESRRKQYLSIKKFIISSENLTDNSILLKQFDNSLNIEQLEIELEKLKTELVKYKSPSMFNIVNNENEFFVSVYDYKTGSDYLQLEINFKDLLEQKFGSWSVKYKDELDLEKLNQLDEEAQLETDFNDIMSIPPTEAPTDKNDNKN